MNRGGRAQIPTVKDVGLDNAYSIMQSMENKLGGGEGVQGIYGSITRTGMQRIFDSMRNNCGFGSTSVLVDVGAGLGRPLIHALLNPGIRGAHGIEVDDVKVAKATTFIRQTLTELSNRGHTPPSGAEPVIECKSMEQVESFGPATHAYSFWEGIPVSARCAFGKLFADSSHMKCVAVVQRSVRAQHPTQLMDTYGFGPLMLIANFSVSMSGSGAAFQAYIFSKIPAATTAFFNSVRPAPTLAGRAPAGTPPAKAAAAATAQKDTDPGAAARAQQELAETLAAATAAATAALSPSPLRTAAPGPAKATKPRRAPTRLADSNQQPITAFSRNHKQTVRPVIQKDGKARSPAKGPGPSKESGILSDAGAAKLAAAAGSSVAAALATAGRRTSARLTSKAAAVQEAA